MHIIFFTHPAFQAHQSMPRYARWLAEGMEKRGHSVKLWTAKSTVSKMPVPRQFKKWLEYADLFLVFPRWAKKKIKECPQDTLFVFTDHALGPWVPLAVHRRHIIHCHDFMAQKSAIGKIPGQHTSWSGKQYQAFIRIGYTEGKNFISISNRTKQDLASFLSTTPQLSQTVYNGVNPLYQPVDKHTAMVYLSQKLGIDLSKGFILHVGGNQWYKNRPGIIAIYDTWRRQYTQVIPLLMAGEKPDIPLTSAAEKSDFQKDILFISGLSDKEILYAYNAATVFLFPSFDEGFGWPIAEAMACGCPVITTNAAPMSEVGGKAATYIEIKPLDADRTDTWLQSAATALQRIIAFPEASKERLKQQGFENVKRFNSEERLNQIEEIYKQVK